MSVMNKPKDPTFIKGLFNPVLFEYIVMNSQVQCMDINKLQGIRTKKKWYYNDLGEKIDYVTEVYLIEETDDDDVEH